MFYLWNSKMPSVNAYKYIIKCERYVLIILVLHDRVKAFVIANQWLINNRFYVLLLKHGTFEVT